MALCDADMEDAKETKPFLTLWNIHILEQTAEQAGILQDTFWEDPEVSRVQGLRIKYSWVFYRKKTQPDCEGHRKLDGGEAGLLHVIIYFGVQELHCPVKI